MPFPELNGALFIIGSPAECRWKRDSCKVAEKRKNSQKLDSYSKPYVPMLNTVHTYISLTVLFFIQLAIVFAAALLILICNSHPTNCVKG